MTVRCCPCGHWFTTRKGNLKCRYCRDTREVRRNRAFGKHIGQIAGEIIVKLMRAV